MQNDTDIKLIALAYDNDWLGILHFDACMGQFPFILDGLPSKSMGRSSKPFKTYSNFVS